MTRDEKRSLSTFRNPKKLGYPPVVWRSNYCIVVYLLLTSERFFRLLTDARSGGRKKWTAYLERRAQNFGRI